jgi:hypothetical protein
MGQNDSSRTRVVPVFTCGIFFSLQSRISRPRSGGDIQTLTDELVRGWEESKARLRSVAGQDLSRHYFEHYRLGPLNIYETIAFQGYHAQKHLDQMKRTLTEISTSV